MDRNPGNTQQLWGRLDDQQNPRGFSPYIASVYRKNESFAKDAAI